MNTPSPGSIVGAVSLDEYGELHRLAQQLGNQLVHGDQLAAAPEQTRELIRDVCRAVFRLRMQTISMPDVALAIIGVPHDERPSAEIISFEAARAATLQEPHQ